MSVDWLRRLCPWVGLLGLVVSCAEASEDGVSVAESSITTNELGEVFELFPRLHEERSSRARYRELAGRASATLFTPHLDDTGARVVTSNGSMIRGTCGATFVSPSLAVTSAHCVNGPDADLSALSVQLYRLTPEILESPALSGGLLGSFPDFETARLTEADGYHVDSYPCELVTRCGAGWGPAVGCDEPAAYKYADNAVLKCAGRPGDKYGFVEVALQDDFGGEVYLPWSHELYDIELPLPESDDRWQHYVLLGSDPSDNFHYFGEHPERGEQNQLLPLFSPDFQDGSTHVKVRVSQSGVTTDLMGCHGTSGSGAMQPIPSGELQYLGPVRFGDSEVVGHLCNHVPALDGSTHGPGAIGITYDSLIYARYALELPEVGWSDDCGSSSSGAVNWPLSGWLARRCQRDYLSSLPENANASGFVPATEHHPLDPASSPALLLAPGESFGFGSVELAANDYYRVGLVVRPSFASDAGAGSIPPQNDAGANGGPSVNGADANATSEISLYWGEHAVHTWALSDNVVTSLSAGFTAPETAALPLSLRATGAERTEITVLSLVREAAPFDFDREASRRLVVLQDLQQEAQRPRPMRFIGDGRNGFEAQLLENERMVIAFAGLEAGHRFEARFRATGGPLSCGFLGAEGDVVSRADCTSGSIVLDDRVGEGTRIGFFVQTAAAGATVDDLRLVSDASPDTDGDGTLDGLDECPTGLVLPGVELQWNFAEPSPAKTCFPGPVEVLLAGPSIDGLCELGATSGEVTHVNDVALPVPLPVDSRLLLPPGVHRVVWSLRDSEGEVYARAEQRLSVSFEPDATCCTAEQRLVEEPVVLESGTGICLLGSEQALTLASADAADWVFGSRGADYLHAGGGEDTVLGGDGDDVIIGGAGATLVAFGGDGDDTIFGNLATSAVISAGSGRDVVVGSDGADVITVGQGTELVAAGAGNDTLILYDPCELTTGMQLDGGEGRDELRSPLSRSELEAQGAVLEGIEEVVVVDARHLAECFGAER